MQTDIPAIYSILLGKRYQEQLFLDLGVGKKEKGGRETLVKCPFCQTERKFSYSSEKPLWRCWHCREAGDWIHYLMKAKGLDFKGAVLELAHAAGVEVSGVDQQRYRQYAQKAGVLEAAQAFFVDALHQDAGRPVKEYLLERGYSEADIGAMHVGAYVDRRTLQKHLKTKHVSEGEIRQSGLLTSGFGETHTLMIPWEDAAGRTIGLVGRTILPTDQFRMKGISKYKYSAGFTKSEGLIGISSIRGCNRIVLVEGVLDACYLNSKGLRTASIGGTDLSMSQIALLERSGAKEILLALDMDDAGRAATAEAGRLLPRSKIRAYVVSLPDTFKDPDEFVRKDGVEAFEIALDRAEPWPRWHARHICNLHDVRTDRGVDNALGQALDAFDSLDDALDRRRFLDSLKSATGLNDEEIAGKLRQHEQKIAGQRKKKTIDGMLTKLQQNTSDADQFTAELERGLLALRANRGIEMPQPYLLADLQNDALRTPDGLATGYGELDAYLKVPRGAITIVAGRPGHGKTTLLLNLLNNFLARNPDQRFYFFSYEEARVWLAIKLLMILGGEIIDADHNQAEYLKYLRGRPTCIRSLPAIDEALKMYSAFAESGRLTIVDGRPCAEELASTIAHVARNSNVGGIIIDYIQKIPLREPPAGQRYQEVKRVSELILEQAVIQGIPILLGAQLGRSNVAGGRARVRLDNLRESGDIEQDASLVLGIFNPSAEKTENDDDACPAPEVNLEISALKNRGGVQGRHAKLSFQKSTLRIRDPQHQSTGVAPAGW